jgi:hypothetical protein
MRASLVLALFLSGCALAQIDRSPQPGYALVTVARMSGGTSAVKVYGINSKHRFRTQPVKDIRSFAVKPGTYLLDVDCFRPGAGALVDASFDFVVSVEANKRYVLDCAPKPEEAGNGFFISVGGS